MKTIVVGLGNLLLADDGVGLRFSARLRRMLPPTAGVTVTEARAGGLALMETLVGYERALLIDAMVSGVRDPGCVTVLAGARAADARHLLCTHDGDLAGALRLARDLGLPVPEQIDIIAIEVETVEHFSETLSRRVEAAWPEVLRVLLGRLGLAASPVDGAWSGGTAWRLADGRGRDAGKEAG